MRPVNNSKFQVVNLQAKPFKIMKLMKFLHPKLTFTERKNTRNNQKQKYRPLYISSYICDGLLCQSNFSQQIVMAYI